MKWLRFILLSLTAVVLVWTLNTKLGDIPPLGKLLSPFTGFWQNNESGKLKSEELRIPGLKETVRILIDDNLVPHIFAKNDHDLYLAQGYIHAKYRLFQMEFQTHAAAGRISEIIGSKAIVYDRQQRRFGMVYGAENSLREMEKDPECKEAIEAYTEGVNSWIRSLSSKNFPIEYKLLDYRPEPWTALKCALLLKYMTYDLAGKSDDWNLTNVLKKYGVAAVDSLFTHRPYVNDPIVPSGTAWDFTPLRIPDPPPALIADIPPPPFDHQPNPDNGSNNWAVNGSKTATGYPILCGDPHLGLNLPSLWYEMQLVSPTCNVSGVSLPGVPTIIIGFNKQIAWSETNVEADVLDWYSVRFRNASNDEYFYNDEWRKTTKKAEVIKVRGSEDVIDTVIYTIHGPVVAMENQQLLRQDIPQGFAMRWLGHDGSLEMKTFLMLNRAGSYNDYVKAISYFGCPAQNFVYADADNNIAIWVNGKYPLKWKGQGKFLMDGSKTENDWQGFLPHDHDPHVKNPPENFVSSANQDPADSTYPYYLNWSFAVPTRAQRINERLNEMKGITADSMRMLQDDDKNMIAAYVLPSMIMRVDATKFNERQNQVLQSLRQWNYSATAESADQSFFDEWWKNLKTAIWGDEFGGKDMLYPEPDIIMQTVKKNINQNWIDDKSTPQVETLDQLVNQTFVASVDSMQKKYGTDLQQWDWADIKKTHISHLLRIPAFSKTLVKTGGAANIVNATSGDHGPSWRMIVELGALPKAYGIYPGGQSGNPGSPFYDNMVERWRIGEQNELLILQNENENNPKVMGLLTLKK